MAKKSRDYLKEKRAKARQKLGGEEVSPPTKKKKTTVGRNTRRSNLDETLPEENTTENDDDPSEEHEEDEETTLEDKHEEQSQSSTRRIEAGIVEGNTVPAANMGAFVKDCEDRGHVISPRQIENNIKNIAKKELFRRLKSYKMFSSREKKEENEATHKYLLDFYRKRLDVPVEEGSVLWTGIQQYTTRALRSKRSSVTEAIKKLFIGK